MCHSIQTEQEAENKREWQPHDKWNKDEKKHMGFKSNHVLQNIIIDIANDRRESISGTIRMLLYLGIDQYRFNKQSGIVTTAQRQQDKARQEAEAQALAARKAEAKQRRSSKGKQDTAQAVTPMLFGTDTED